MLFLLFMYATLLWGSRTSAPVTSKFSNFIILHIYYWKNMKKITLLEKTNKNRCVSSVGKIYVL